MNIFDTLVNSSSKFNLIEIDIDTCTNINRAFFTARITSLLFRCNVKFEFNEHIFIINFKECEKKFIDLISYIPDDDKHLFVD